MVDQRQRQIVDDFPAHILERAKHGRLAGAGQAGDEQEALGMG